MTVLSAQSILRMVPIEDPQPRTRFNGLTYGVGPAGYDIRVSEYIDLWAGRFVLASSIERFNMPLNVLGIVHDKSTWARKGVCVQNTVIEPGWRGYLTLEITNHGGEYIRIDNGTPIAQVIFHLLDESTHNPYEGKYQDQPSGAQEAIFEGAGSKLTNK